MKYFWQAAAALVLGSIYSLAILAMHTLLVPQLEHDYYLGIGLAYASGWFVKGID